MSTSLCSVSVQPAHCHSRPVLDISDYGFQLLVRVSMTILLVESPLYTLFKLHCPPNIRTKVYVVSTRGSNAINTQFGALPIFPLNVWHHWSILQQQKFRPFSWQCLLLTVLDKLYPRTAKALIILTVTVSQLAVLLAPICENR